MNYFARKLKVPFSRCFWLALFLGIQGLGVNVPAWAGSACMGDADCTACQNTTIAQRRGSSFKRGVGSFSSDVRVIMVNNDKL